jgi:hypothetical protein
VVGGGAHPSGGTAWRRWSILRAETFIGWEGAPVAMEAWPCIVSAEEGMGGSHREATGAVALGRKPERRRGSPVARAGEVGT